MGVESYGAVWGVCVNGGLWGGVECAWVVGYGTVWSVCGCWVIGLCGVLCV